MSHLQYIAYPGVGERNCEKYRYNQAVRVGDRIECAGQGGWDPSTGSIPFNLNAEIDQAFANVDLNLKHAGGSGWEQVFRVNSYHVALTERDLERMVRNFAKWMPNHKPIWTAIGVSSLRKKDMLVEIEVVAHVGDEVEGEVRRGEEGSFQRRDSDLTTLQGSDFV
ncbi:NRAMP-like transporter smf-3 [Cladophialophora chaetospira]|uniref:NRAMP-like transporter smf-3 n=1 Tax=Cladophialophora chaetospira TaxID=386627 RepID=A0AA38XB54_9EURO|nr:NRAMP-like transporter smf-3 [Cladophialophora chaetospira]